MQRAEMMLPERMETAAESARLGKDSGAHHSEFRTFDYSPATLWGA